MRQPNDTILAEKAVGIDLILGGHDHVYSIHTSRGITVLKSGTDFRDFSVITVTLPSSTGGKPNVDIQRISVTSDYEEDPQLKTELEQFSSIGELPSRPKSFLRDFIDECWKYFQIYWIPKWVIFWENSTVTLTVDLPLFARLRPTWGTFCVTSWLRGMDQIRI